jgi:arylsulfatase A-like enzyme
LGDKELFHDASVRVPLIIVDPSPAADATRGMVRDELVEAIDLLPTFVEMAGGTVPHHILEGHSLVPLLHSMQRQPLRDAVFSEYDYAFRGARQELGRGISECAIQMVFDGRFKMIFAKGFRPALFDLQSDPDELHDLGAQDSFAPEIVRLKDLLLDWALAHHNRVTRSDAAIEAYAGTEFTAGIRIGFWDQADLDEALQAGHGGN